MFPAMPATQSGTIAHLMPLRSYSLVSSELLLWRTYFWPPNTRRLVHGHFLNAREHPRAAQRTGYEVASSSRSPQPMALLQSPRPLRLLVWLIHSRYVGLTLDVPILEILLGGNHGLPLGDRFLCSPRSRSARSAK